MNVLRRILLSMLLALVAACANTDTNPQGPERGSSEGTGRAGGDGVARDAGMGRDAGTSLSDTGGTDTDLGGDGSLSDSGTLSPDSTTGDSDVSDATTVPDASRPDVGSDTSTEFDAADSSTPSDSGTASPDVPPAPDTGIGTDAGRECEIGESRACYGGDPLLGGVGACANGSQTCGADGWGTCFGWVTPSEEACNGEDDDCDGMTDEALTRACSTTCGMGQELCAFGEWGTCSAPAPRPEICDNGEDDDCNGSIDDGCVDECAGTARTRIGFDAFELPGLVTIAESAGLTVVDTGFTVSAAELASVDIVVIDGLYLSDAVTVSDFEALVDRGGVVLLTGSPLSTSCNRINGQIGGIGVRFDCRDQVTGAVSRIGSHPVLTGVTGGNLAFGSGSAVQEDFGATELLSWVFDSPPGEEKPTGVLLERGCGAVLLFGSGELVEGDNFGITQRFFEQFVSWSVD